MLFVKIFSSLMLIGSNLLEFFMQINPCSLCWYQRFCWMIILVVSLMYKYIYKYVYLIILSLLIGIGIGIYQILLQYKIIIESNVCKIDILAITSSSKMPDCSVIDYSIFKLPLSFYNIALSLFLLGYVIYYHNKNKKQ
jgi:disulfide bond formation protein DsbB